MVTSDGTCNPESGSRTGNRRYLERIREAIEYLEALDPHELKPEDHAEIEEAILKVWARMKIQEDFRWCCRGLTSDIRSVWNGRR